MVHSRDALVPAEQTDKPEVDLWRLEPGVCYPCRDREPDDIKVTLHNERLLVTAAVNLDAVPELLKQIRGMAALIDRKATPTPSQAQDGYGAPTGAECKKSNPND